MDFSTYLAEQLDAVNHALDAYLAQYTDPALELSQAMRYSSLMGGKRIRPVLVLATAESFGVTKAKAMPFACAMEFIHAYSLVHDDLPAMDDDDLRRGQQTCHIKYDEATAILAGDALQTLAFQIVADENTSGLSTETKLSIVRTLAEASGPKGMVGGQALDLSMVGQAPSLAQLNRMHRLKTGALIEASVAIGALCSELAKPSELDALSRFASAIGLGFQVQDDILDVISDTETLGKQQGADQALNKPTYPSLIGLEDSKAQLKQLHQDALQALQQLPGRHTDTLASIADYIVHRIK